MCDGIHMSNIDAGRWTQLKAAAMTKLGVEVKEDSGIYKARGFGVSWSYADSTLMVQVINHPVFLPCDYINSMLLHGINSL